MPGYIIHLSEAEMIIEALQQKGFLLDEDWKNRFRLGCLLPDTKRKREKVTSHFWREETLEDMAIAPCLQDFEKKYHGKIAGPLMLGYWAHLQLDEDYVRQFWPSMLRFTDRAGEEKVKKKDIDYVHLIRTNINIPLDKFFSSEYYYGDFDRSNYMFYQKYHVIVPEMERDLECPVEEVDLQDLNEVLEELSTMLQKKQPSDTRLRVFELSDLEAFLEETAQKAAVMIEKSVGRKNE